MIQAMLAAAVAATFLPEALAACLGGTVAAWFYAMSGVEAAALWAAACAWVCATQRGHELITGRAVCAWAVFESMQRPICRLVFPMDRPPKIPEGKNLCDVATGLPMSLVSVIAALFLAALVQEFERARR